MSLPTHPILVGPLLLGIGSALLLFNPEMADAQVVRRFGGGGVQVNAPGVRVNVGPGGATSVRAPFSAVNTQRGFFLGRRRMLQANGLPRSRSFAQPPTKQPTPVDVDSLAYPTTEQLAAMDDDALVETLREMMGRLNYRLSLFKTGESWQNYLVLSREILGAPGASPEEAELEAIQKMLPRFQGVQDDSQFEKIAALPSFMAVFESLQEAEQRLQDIQPSVPKTSGPTIAGPTVDKQAPTESVAETTVERNKEILPTPQPAELPNATRGEHSILKRK